MQIGEKLWLADRDSNRTTPAVADISWSGRAWPPLVLRSRLRLRTDDFLGAGRSGAIANLLVASWKTPPLFTRRERAPNLVRVSPRAACPRTCTSCYRARARNSDQGQCDVDGMHRDSARATSAGTFIVPSEGTGIRRISKTRRCKTCRSRPKRCLLIGQLHNRGLGRRYTTHGRPSGGRTDGRTFVPLNRARDLRDSLKEALPPFFSVVGEDFHLARSFDAFGRIYVLEHDNLRLLAKVAEMIEEALLEV